MISRLSLSAALILTAPAAASAQEAPDEQPRRTRVALGPQLQPRYPGSDEVQLRPFGDVSRARGDDPFAFEAPDESIGFALFTGSGFSAGPALAFQGSRRRRDTPVGLPRVGFTVEAGGFVQTQITPAIRARAEARYGIGGHEGLIGDLGLDYVTRRGDDWLFSVGPRLTLANDRYQRAYFGVRTADALRTGLPAYRADGGVRSAGATAGLLRQFTPRWGATGFARYDRLVGDAADSPVVRRFGSRNQFSAGVAATYTFGARR